MSTVQPRAAVWLPVSRLAGWLAAALCCATLAMAGDEPRSTGSPARPSRPVALIKEGSSTAASAGSQASSHEGWVSLFDGRTLNGWKKSDFSKPGRVEVKNGELWLGAGNDLTGVTIDCPIPHTNYEVSLEAKRVDGSDFFCGLTFPVKEDPCTLILGGWGGGVCGLSSIDGSDASENNTSSYHKFDNGRWYAVRLRVTDDKIEAWIDKEQIVEQELRDHAISIRLEVEPSKPFGLATWRTGAALRNIRIRRLK